MPDALKKFLRLKADIEVDFWTTNVRRILKPEPGNDILYVVLLVEENTNNGVLLFGEHLQGREQFEF
jgi:hypothetical protein